jgi:hypothetical protein
MKTYSEIDAIMRLVPNAEFNIRDGVLEWLDERPQPSQEEINAEVING